MNEEQYFPDMASLLERAATSGLRGHIRPLAAKFLLFALPRISVDSDPTLPLSVLYFSI